MNEGLTCRANVDVVTTWINMRHDITWLNQLTPRLQIVSQYAVGVNNIDLDAAKRLGVRVANTPDVVTDATAELAVTLMLACLRRVVEGDRLTRGGLFQGWAPTLLIGRGLTGKIRRRPVDDVAIDIHLIFR